MTADNRTVSTDALETLGMIISEHENRDAIHLAVEPIKSTVKVFPGQDVNSKGVPEEPFVGIVDPFLKNPVHPDQWFWLVIYPRKIQSLRHVWTHPAFEGETQKSLSDVEKSKEWIESFSKEHGIIFEEMIQGATDFIKSDGFHQIELSEDFYDAQTPDEFWEHYEIFTGHKVFKHKIHHSLFKCCC